LNLSPGTEIQGCLLGDNFPRTSGYASVFRIEQVGREVTGYKPGDIAFCLGNHRSYQKIQIPTLAKVPDTLDPKDACCARFMGVSMTTLTTTNIRPPAKVLIMGLGLVGNMAARLFDCCGYSVFAVDPVDDRCKQLATNSRCTVSQSTPHRQDMDLVIDCTGHEQAVYDGSNTLRKGGELVLIGVPWRRRADLQAFEILSNVFRRYIHLRSGWEWEIPRIRGDFDRASIWSNLQGAVNWLNEKRLIVDGIYDVQSPDQCQQAYDRLTKQGDGPLTTVFDWTR
jgi:threonine dehydrogenase-like Zn-dependent dehydrogenase